MFELFPKFGTAEFRVFTASIQPCRLQVMTKLLPLETDPTLTRRSFLLSMDFLTQLQPKQMTFVRFLVV
jgi:hypothetical protein